MSSPSRTESRADIEAGPDDELRAEIEELKAEGEHAAAAAAIWAAGYPAEAGKIYEEIFEHERALAAFEAGDDLAGSMRAALALEDTAAVDRVVTRATRTGRAASLIGMLKARGRHREIGKIYAAAGDLEAAAAAFEQAGDLFRAATCREGMGDMRAAGLLYERHLERVPGDPDACLRLGRILCRFARSNDGIAMLQRALAGATDRDEMMRRCAPLMILGFSQLGYDAAATAVLEDWRTAATDDDPPPETLDAFFQSDRAAALSSSARRQSKKADAAPKPAPGGLDAFFGDSQASNGGKAEADDADDDDDEAEGDTGAVMLADRYLLGEPLGGGGVGQVFRAFDAFSDRPVAVKIFGQQVMRSEAVHAYARETRAASALGHAAVAPLVELNMPQGFVVTAFISGQPLEERLQKGSDGRWVVPFARTICDLLAECHRVGLVHGALKPTNLILVPGGLRVVDFGGHHLLALRSTETGGLASVWPYLAPEQLFGAPADVSADLYAVAAILYRALTGSPPFDHAAADRREAPTPAKERRLDLPDDWNRFLEKALAPKAADRFVDAASFAEAIPELPLETVLPKAAAPGGRKTVPAPISLEASDRYSRGPLAWRGDGDLRVYESTDLTLDRTVWLVECGDLDRLRPLIACAGLGPGAQPVYDVLEAAGQVVVARDATRKRRPLTELRDDPQTLTRGLAGLARAVEALHGEGHAFNGFDLKRAIGPTGPRMRLAPAPLPVPLSAESQAKDQRSLSDVVLAALGAPESEAHPREALIDHLRFEGMLDRSDEAALKEFDGPWSAFLQLLTDRFVQAAPQRLIARLAASVLRGDSR